MPLTFGAFHLFKTLILALIKSWFKAFLMFSNWRFLFLRLMISLSKPLKMLAIAICSFRGGKRISKSKILSFEML
nr:hypothetical protein HPHPH23_0104 [Helicobacter pylori Hp H-23]